MRRKPGTKRRRSRTRIVDTLTADAIRRVGEAWSRAESDGAVTDGSDLDPERGPEDERTIAGERVRTFIDKVFGGRAVTVLRREGGRVLQYPLGRVSSHETPGSVLGPELTKSLGLPPRASAAAVVKGVWRNDRNGWITDQITALTEQEAIEQLVTAFKRQQEPRSVEGQEQLRSSPLRSASQRSAKAKSRRRKTAKAASSKRESPRAPNEDAATREAMNKWRLGTEMVPRRDLARYVEDLTHLTERRVEKRPPIDAKHVGAGVVVGYARALVVDVVPSIFILEVVLQAMEDAAQILEAFLSVNATSLRRT